MLALTGLVVIVLEVLVGRIGRLLFDRGLGFCHSPHGTLGPMECVETMLQIWY